MPLDNEFLENKRLARQVYEQELVEKQKESKISQTLAKESLHKKFANKYDKRLDLIQKNEKQK